MNKVILSVFVLLFAFGSCKTKKGNKEMTTDIVNNPVTADGNYSTESLPKFEFAKKHHDFGVIIQGEKVSYTFKFKNDDSTAILSQVRLFDAKRLKFRYGKMSNSDFCGVKEKLIEIGRAAWRERV